MSDTWDRVESMQAQEIRLTLERDIGMILQEACGLVNQTINRRYKTRRLAVFFSKI